jgi:site-specific DNA recombinase
MRDAAADGAIDIVLVYCPDRLARNFVYQHVLIEELCKRDVEVHFVERPVTERAEDRLLVQMQGVIAEYERAKIIERTRRGRLHKLRSGQSIPYGAEAPYGYAIEHLGDGTKVVVVNEVEAQNVRAMYAWVLDDGLSSRAVAKRLNDLGTSARRTRRWSQGTAYNVLTNPAYVGLAPYNRREAIEPRRPKNPGSYRTSAKSSNRLRPESQWIRVPIPALVDAEVQRQVAATLRKHKIISPRNLQHPYLLRTLVVCGECGWRMECAHDRRGPYEYFYYACRHADPLETGDDTKCTARRVRRDELDKVVWEAVTAWLQRPEMLIQEVQAWRNSQAGAAQMGRDRARAENAERQATLQIGRLVDAYQRGALGLDELQARRERLEAERTAARLRQQELQATESDRSRLEALSADLIAFAAKLRSGMDQLDFQGRQRLVRLLVERVVVTGTHVAIEHAIPLSGRFAGLQQHRQPFAMPTKNGLWLHQQDNVLPAVNDSRKQNHQTTLVGLEYRAFDFSGCHDQLLSQQSVLSDWLPSGTSQIPQQPNDHRQGTDRVVQQTLRLGHKASQSGTDAKPQRRQHGGLVLLQVGQPIKSCRNEKVQCSCGGGNE